MIRCTRYKVISLWSLVIPPICNTNLLRKPKVVRTKFHQDTSLFTACTGGRMDSRANRQSLEFFNSSRHSDHFHLIMHWTLAKLLLAHATKVFEFVRPIYDRWIKSIKEGNELNICVIFFLKTYFSWWRSNVRRVQLHNYTYINLVLIYSMQSHCALLLYFILY